MILLLSVRLLDDRFHGLTANGEKPEWPPSPFRLFQAIVAGNAHGEVIPPKVVDALQWLETLEPPEIIVPTIQTARVLLTYVLNNSEGRSRTQKFIRPMSLNGDRLIEFAWTYDPASVNSQDHCETLVRAVRHVRAFGWGIDLAVGHGQVIARLPEKSESRRQFSPRDGVDALGIDIRSPRRGSLASLQDCYAQYLGRFESNESTVLESGGPIYQLRAYTTEHARPHAVFKLLDANEDAHRYPHAKLIHIAAMLRHVAIERMKNDPPPWKHDDPTWVERFVCGHRGDALRHQQISYVPLPSIGHEYADAMIRNVMLIAPLGCERELEYVAERIDGEKLKPQNEVNSIGPQRPRSDPAQRTSTVSTRPRESSSTPAISALQAVGTRSRRSSSTGTTIRRPRRRSSLSKPRSSGPESKRRASSPGNRSHS